MADSCQCMAKKKSFQSSKDCKEQEKKIKQNKTNKK